MYCTAAGYTRNKPFSMLNYPDYSLIRTHVWEPIYNDYLFRKWLITYPEIPLSGQLACKRRCLDKWGVHCIKLVLFCSGFTRNRPSGVLNSAQEPDSLSNTTWHAWHNGMLHSLFSLKKSIDTHVPTSSTADSVSNFHWSN